jgi:hypothetical protein
MKRIVVVAIAIAALAPEGIAKKKEVPSDPPPGYVRNYSEGLDMIYRPVTDALMRTRPGRRTVTVEKAPIAVDLDSLRLAQQSVKVGDSAGILELLRNGQIAEIASGTSVLVIEVDGAEDLIAKRKRKLRDYSEYASKVIRACDIGARLPDCMFLRVPDLVDNVLDLLRVKIRMLDGEYAERAAWTFPLVLAPVEQ